MPRLQVVLLLLFAGVSLTLAFDPYMIAVDSDSDESDVDSDETVLDNDETPVERDATSYGGYFFVFNDENDDRTDSEHAEEMEATKGDMRRLLKSSIRTRNDFRFRNVRGFLVDLTADQLMKLKLHLGHRGSFHVNGKISLNPPRPVVETKPFKRPSGSPTCIGKQCCTRSVSVDFNSNLDWLDGSRNGKYCSPGDDTTKMDVFVMDTGVDKDHPDFNGRVTTDDCSSDGPPPWTPDVDKNGHGTHVAGTVGSNTYGATPNVFIHSVKVLNDQGSGSTANMICGFDKVQTWLDNNPTKKAIVSMSLGFSVVVDLIDRITTSLATTYADRLVIVVASGNSNKNACDSTYGSVAAVVTVGSTSPTLSESSFSNYGSCVAIMAPGERILSLAPSNKLAIMSGTSMATPLVSGVLAQYWLENPQLTGLDIRNAIGSTSSALFAKLVVNLKPGSPDKLTQYNCPTTVSTCGKEDDIALRAYLLRKTHL